MKKSKKKEETRFPVVGVGASAGGLEALEELFSSFSRDTNLAFVVVQHSDPNHESLLPEILAKRTPLRVVIATEDGVPARGTVYIAPSNAFLTFQKGRFRLTPRPKTRELTLPIDLLLRSLAAEFDECGVAVILSGGGSDGALGLQEVKAKGGITFAQDEGSARFYSMPHSAVFTGSVDFVLPPREIALSLQKLALHGYLDPRKKPTPVTLEKEEDFRAILSLVYRSSGIDFKQYKYPTVSRRILRRMALKNIEGLGEYLKVLKEDSAEVAALGQDILIQVTKFFRDPEVFEGLKERILPDLFSRRPQDEAIRVWVPGCSSGEEVYSVLICLVEFLESVGLRNAIQMFGSDISDAAIVRARAGSYVENITMDVSADRLRRFFTKVGESYEINKTLRDMCIFARHNLASDPPFGRLDLITCRNVLIYLEPALQKKVLSVFHYALKSDGILLLGNAETADADLYRPIDTQYRVYGKKPATNRLYFDYAATQHAAERAGSTHVSPPAADDVSKGLQIQREADRILLSEFVPPGVIVAQNFEVIQFRGRTGPYFEHAPGFASLDLLKMLREGLVSEVRSALEAARANGITERREGIQLRTNGDTKKVAIEVIPVPSLPPRDRFFLLLFEDMEAPEYATTQSIRAIKRANRTPEDEASELASIRAELISTKDYLQSINEEKEAANEELKAANEEIMSSNEELQSMNEELHTSKEELQSTNEELTTLNDELRLRNAELAQLSDDMSNLFTSLNSAVILLKKDFRVRKFTPMAERLLRLIPADIGRSVFDIRSNIEIVDLEQKLKEVLSQVVPKELEVEDKHGRWFSLHIRPYRTSDDRIDGLVLLFSDITTLKTSLIYAEALESTVSNPLLVLGGDLKVRRANRSFYETFKTHVGETEGKPLYQLGYGQWDIAELGKLLEEVLQSKADLRDYEVTQAFPGIGTRTMKLNARRLFYRDRATETILLSIKLEP